MCTTIAAIYLQINRNVCLPPTGNITIVARMLMKYQLISTNTIMAPIP